MSIRDHVFWKEFFNVYRQLPELWKVKSDAYRNRMKRRRGYAILLKKYKEYEPDATEDLLKKKINNIRVSYRRELNKILKSYETANSSDEVYKPTLWYFNELDFLRAQEEDDNQEESQITSLEIESNFNNSEIIEENYEDQEDLVSIDDLNNTSNSKLTIFKPKFVSSTTKTSCDRRHSKKHTTEKVLEDLKSICNALSQPLEEENEFESFGTSIASQLKKLPENIAQESMEHIQSFLVRQRLKCKENSFFETKNTKRIRFDLSDPLLQDTDASAEINQMHKKIKEMEMEFMMQEFNDKKEIFRLEKSNLEQRIRFEEEEHMYKMENLSKLSRN